MRNKKLNYYYIGGFAFLTCIGVVLFCISIALAPEQLTDPKDGLAFFLYLAKAVLFVIGLYTAIYSAVHIHYEIVELLNKE